MTELNPDPDHRADVREGEAGSQVLLEGRGAAAVTAILDVRDGEEVPVREACALRDAGRAAREHDRGDVVRSDLDAGRFATAQRVDRVDRARAEPLRGEPR